MTKNSATSYTFESTQTPSGPDCDVCFTIPLTGTAGANSLSGNAAGAEFSVVKISTSELEVTANHPDVGTCTWTYTKSTATTSASVALSSKLNHLIIAALTLLVTVASVR